MCYHNWFAKHIVALNVNDSDQLDVYYPPADAIPSTGNVPVLYFFYGGGFFEGDRRLAPPYDLVYSNTGAYFAKRG